MVEKLEAEEISICILYYMPYIINKISVIKDKKFNQLHETNTTFELSEYNCFKILPRMIILFT